MDLSDKEANDKTKTGVFCPKDKEEMESVSDSDRFTCHWCGGIYRVVDGKIEEVWFEGFE